MAQRLGPESFQTFGIVSPKETHTVPATCEEVECDHHIRGWMMKLDLGTELGQRQAHYIKYNSGRSFTHENLGDGLVTLTFQPGQKCFQEHRRSIERDPIFRVKGGDGRGNPLRVPTRVHKKPEFWVEEFAENQDRIATAIEKG